MGRKLGLPDRKVGKTSGDALSQGLLCCILCMPFRGKLDEHSGQHAGLHNIIACSISENELVAVITEK